MIIESNNNTGEPMTALEATILLLVALGFETSRIVSLLAISEQSAEYCMNCILQKTNLTRQTQSTLFAIRG